MFNCLNLTQTKTSTHTRSHTHTDGTNTISFNKIIISLAVVTYKLLDVYMHEPGLYLKNNIKLPCDLGVGHVTHTKNIQEITPKQKKSNKFV